MLIGEVRPMSQEKGIEGSLLPQLIFLSKFDEGYGMVQDCKLYLDCMAIVENVKRDFIRNKYQTTLKAGNGKKRRQGLRPCFSILRQGGETYFLNLRRIATSPSRPEPKSHTAPGMGTAAVDTLK